MISKAKRLIAGILIGGVLATSLMPGTVSAEDNVEDNVIVENNEALDLNQDGTGKEIEENAGEMPEEHSVEVVPEAQEAEVQEVEEIQEQVLEYLYVESPYLETPGEQNLVVSWGDGTEQIEKMELLYQYNDQETGSFELENKGEGLYLYQSEFSDAESGTYALTDIRMLKEGQEYTYNLSEMGIEACFGVNEYYSGYEPERVDADEGVACLLYTSDAADE